MFPVAPTYAGGYLHLNDQPGFGVEFDEKPAGRCPSPADPGNWPPVRRRDGSIARP
jgi:hypothetical protein